MTQSDTLAACSRCDAVNELTSLIVTKLLKTFSAQFLIVFKKQHVSEIKTAWFFFLHLISSLKHQVASHEVMTILRVQPLAMSVASCSVGVRAIGTYYCLCCIQIFT